MQGFLKKGVSVNGARLGLVITGLLWSLGGILIKIIPWNPMVIASLRSLIASGIIYLYIRPQKLRFNRHALTGGIFMGASFICFVVANKLTTSANAIMLQYTSPIFALLILAIFFRAKAKKSDILLVALTMCGIALFFFEKLKPGGMAGNILALFSGFTFACVYVFSSRCGEDALHGILFGNILCFLAGVPFFFIDPPSLAFSSVAAVVVMGVFQLGLPYIIFGEVMKYTSPIEGTLITMAEPLLNPVWVLLWTGETPGILAIAGGVIVLAAIVIKTLIRDGGRAAKMEKEAL